MDRRLQELLEGPRGRRVLDGLRPGATRRGLPLGSPLAPDLLGDALVALQDSVDAARYWQEPDDRDEELARPGQAELLRAVAVEVLAAPELAWWGSLVDLQAQVHVQRVDDPDVLPRPLVEVLRPAGPALEGWRLDVARQEAEAARERPVDVTARWSGQWWSTPALSGLLRTTPQQVGVPPVPPEEDSLGQQHAWVRAVEVALGSRVYEVAGPQDWTDLVRAHPLPVTSSRRHDWWRATGWDGAWALPDWAAVAQEWDAVHVSVLGYLSTDGRALEVGGGVRTVLAGWDPGATWWLADVVAGLGDPVLWSTTDLDDPLAWRPADVR